MDHYVSQNSAKLVKVAFDCRSVKWGQAEIERVVNDNEQFSGLSHLFGGDLKPKGAVPPRSVVPDWLVVHKYFAVKGASLKIN